MANFKDFIEYSSNRNIFFFKMMYGVVVWNTDVTKQ